MQQEYKNRMPTLDTNWTKWKGEQQALCLQGIYKQMQGRDLNNQQLCSTTMETPNSKRVTQKVEKSLCLYEPEGSLPCW